MEAAPYQEALDAAAIDHDLVVMPVTNGLIHQTYKVTTEHSGSKFLLQQINQDVFHEPETVQANYEKIWSHLYTSDPPPGIPCRVSIPAPLNFLDDSKLFYDARGKYWRIFEFIEGSHTLNAPANSIQVKMVAQAFACVTASFENYDLSNLFVTIPGFHDLSSRSKQFHRSLHTRNYERLQQAAPVVQELKKRERYVSLFDVMTESGEFVKRLMHHDAKISNILFDEETGKLICPVDFDTCMPGYFFSDAGDMIRSMACTEGESSTRFDEINILPDHYEAIISGYMEVMDEFFTAAEKKYIHYSGLLMIYMQAIRFMTDHLDGDQYYRVSYPGQNLDRSKNQLVLLQKLEEFLHKHYNFRHD